MACGTRTLPSRGLLRALEHAVTSENKVASSHLGGSGPAPSPSVASTTPPVQRPSTAELVACWRLLAMALGPHSTRPAEPLHEENDP
mgnify:CR=1 FL=1